MKGYRIIWSKPTTQKLIDTNQRLEEIFELVERRIFDSIFQFLKGLEFVVVQALFKCISVIKEVHGELDKVYVQAVILEGHAVSEVQSLGVMLVSLL